MAKRVKQINNLVIKQDTTEYEEFMGYKYPNPNYGKYSIWTPDGRCWEDGLTLEQAEEYCKVTTDFVSRIRYKTGN